MQTTILTIASGADDGYRNAVLSTLVTHDMFYVGDGGGSADHWSFLRFTNVAIAQGTNIVSAVLRIRGASQPDTIPATSLKCEAADNPAAPTTKADMDGRTRTAASVAWAPAAWVKGAVYESPDLSPIIQEIVNRAGWTSGNALILFWEDAAGYGFPGENRRIGIQSFEFGAGFSPQLTIEYGVAQPDSDYPAVFGRSRIRPPYRRPQVELAGDWWHEVMVSVPEEGERTLTRDAPPLRRKRVHPHPTGDPWHEVFVEVPEPGERIETYHARPLPGRRSRRADQVRGLLLPEPIPEPEVIQLEPPLGYFVRRRRQQGQRRQRQLMFQEPIRDPSPISHLVCSHPGAGTVMRIGLTGELLAGISGFGFTDGPLTAMVARVGVGAGIVQRARCDQYDVG